MLKVIIYRGLPASGKTTAARKLIEENPNAYKRINRDDLRAMFDNGKWSGDREKFIIKAQSALILLALEEKRHVVIDDCNLAISNIARIEQLVHGKAEVEIIDMGVSVDECVARDQKRPNYVGEKVIRNMHRQFLMDWTKDKIKNGKYLAHNPALPSAIICDIDGTLAISNGRSPFEFQKCHEDICNEAVRSIIERFSDNTHVIFVSGREEKYRDVTANWIAANVKLVGFHLFMRPTDDKRHDDIVKKEIYEREIAGKYNVRFVIDDRQRVVDMWRSLGLVCLQCDYGDF